MDAIDALLESAWLGLLERLSADRRELYRRLRRRRLGVVAKPIRAWCICLRAADTRIVHERTAFFLEEDARAGLEHEVELPGWGIRELVKPVKIPREGMRSRDAAALLGMSDSAMRPWIRHGVLRVEHDYCRPHGYRGPRCPIVFAGGPLDPNGTTLGRAPDELWGTLWQGHWERVPEGFTCTLRRVARTRSFADGPRMRGWDWLCPRCGRRCRRVYGPLSVWTLHRYLGDVSALMGAERGGSGEEGIDPVALAASLRDPRDGRRSLMCHRCWEVQYTRWTSARAAWNQFVTHISDGLLTGREAPMPAWFRGGSRRRRAFRARAMSEPSRRRAQVLEGVLAGRSSRRIAEALGIRPCTVAAHLTEIYRQHGVRNRRELLALRGLRRSVSPPPKNPAGNPGVPRGAEEEKVGRIPGPTGGGGPAGSGVL